MINELKEVGFTLEEIRDHWNHFSEELFLQRKEKLLAEIQQKQDAIKKTDHLRSHIQNGKITKIEQVVYKKLNWRG